MSLRARLLLVLAALSIVGLLAADVATYTSERSFLTRRVDRTATGIAHSIEAQLASGRPEAGAMEQLAQTTPGVYLGAVLPSGKVVWQPAGAPPGQRPLPKPRLSRSQAAAAPEEANVTLGSKGATHYRAHF